MQRSPAVQHATSRAVKINIAAAVGVLPSTGTNPCIGMFAVGRYAVSDDTKGESASRRPRECNAFCAQKPGTAANSCSHSGDDGAMVATIILQRANRPMQPSSCIRARIGPPVVFMFEVGAGQAMPMLTQDLLTRSCPPPQTESLPDGHHCRRVVPVEPHVHVWQVSAEAAAPGPDLGDCLRRCTVGQFDIVLLGIAGASGVLLGSRIRPYPRGGLNGSSGGTSIASEYFRRVLPQQLNHPWWAPTIRNPLARTRILGAVIGRWIPFVGWGLLISDAVLITQCVSRCLDGEQSAPDRMPPGS